MAENQHTPKPSLAAIGHCQERRLTVSSIWIDKPHGQPHSASRYIPRLRLKGQWLEQAGFKIHMAVRVRVMKGCLVLTVEEPCAPSTPR